MTMTGASIHTIPGGFQDSGSGREDNERKIIVFENEAQCASFIVAFWREVCSETLEAKPSVSAALSGGRSPAGAYSPLAMAKDLPWKMIHVFMVDERFVPHDDQDSNFGMIRTALLDHVPIPKENVYPIETKLKGPVEAAGDYEKKLSQHFNLKKGELPRFDIVMLGLGEDGHTASIFPGGPVPDDQEDRVQAVFAKGTGRDRVTLTMPVINNARHILMLVLGQNKAAILRKIVDDRDKALPGSRVRPAHGQLLVIADRDAAGSLAQGSYREGPAMIEQSHG